MFVRVTVEIDTPGTPSSTDTRHETPVRGSSFKQGMTQHHAHRIERKLLMI